MSAAIWPIPHPEGAYVREDGIVFRREEEPFASDILSRHPDCLAEPMALEYARLYVAEGKAEAYLKAISDQLVSTPLGLSVTDEEIDFLAKKVAGQFFHMQQWFSNSAAAAYILSRFAQRVYGVVVPWAETGKAIPLSAKSVSVPVTVLAKKPLLLVPVSVPGTGEKNAGPCPVSVTDTVTDTGAKLAFPISVTVTDTDRQAPVTVTGESNPSFPVSVTDTGVNNAGVLARLADEYWWRKALRKVHIRRFEHGAIRLGLVHSRKGKYVSDETLQRRQKQNRRNRTILEHCTATNELGQEFTLQQLADVSVSNPKIRRAELMTRIAGFDALRCL